MKRLFLLTGCALFACALFAQHIPTPFDSVVASPYTKLKRELSWDLKGFYYAAPTVTLTYRQQLAKKRKHTFSNNAIRIHATSYFGFPFSEITDIDVTLPNTVNNFASEPIDQHYSAINLFAGIEKQHFLRRIVFYHGLEMGGGYSRFTSKYFSATSPFGEQANEQHVAERKIFLSCFAGLKFFIVPQISVSIECNVYGGINFQQHKIDYFEFDSSGSNAVHTTSMRDVQHYFLKSNRLRTLNVGFHF
jgi:hypothetical protein